MEYPRLFVSALIGCVLVGASGAAMAEGCGDGLLIDEKFEGSLRVTDEESCTIIGSVIGGSLRVINVRNVVLVNNKVGSLIRVDGNAGIGTATVVQNSVFGGRLIVRDYATANVVDNETPDVNEGDIRVVQNGTANVQENKAARDLLCISNTDTNSFFNTAGRNFVCDNSDF